MSQLFWRVFQQSKQTDYTTVHGFLVQTYTHFHRMPFSWQTHKHEDDWVQSVLTIQSRVLVLSSCWVLVPEPFDARPPPRVQPPKRKWQGPNLDGKNPLRKQWSSPHRFHESWNPKQNCDAHSQQAPSASWSEVVHVQNIVVGTLSTVGQTDPWRKNNARKRANVRRECIR